MMEYQTRYLLRKYLEGALAETERAELSGLLKSEEGQKALAEMIDENAQELLLKDLTLEPHISGKMWQNLEDRMGAPGRPATTRWQWVGWAASVFLLCCIGGILLLNRGPVEALTYTTDASQKRTVILPDGSLVTLNSNSEISYREKKEAREVELSGEAYFAVKHDADRPFFVTAREVRVKVLGTSFNVKAYESEDNISTTLLKGKVLLESRAGNNASVELEPDQHVSFARKEQAFVRGDIRDYYAAGWRNGNLVFENEPLKNIIPELEKWYGVPFEIDESMLDCRFSMAIGDEGLEQLLLFFELSAGTAMTRLPGGGVRLDTRLCD